MLDIRLKVRPTQRAAVESLLKAIPGGARKAMARALNRTIEGVRTDVVRAITESYAIRARDVRETMAIERAKPERLFAWLRSRGHVIPLDRFETRPTGPTRTRPPIGVRVRVKKGAAGRAVAGSFFVGFTVTQARRVTRGGQRGGDVSRRIEGLFMRVGAGRHPIRRLQGPSVPSMMGSVLDRNEEIQERALDRLEREVAHEADFLLQREASR